MYTTRYTGVFHVSLCLCLLFGLGTQGRRGRMEGCVVSESHAPDSESGKWVGDRGGDRGGDDDLPGDPLTGDRPGFGEV